MTISELIALLNAFKTNHGDLPVCIENQEFRCYEDANEIAYFEGRTEADRFADDHQTVFIGLRHDFRRGR